MRACGLAGCRNPIGQSRDLMATTAIFPAVASDGLEIQAFRRRLLLEARHKKLGANIRKPAKN
jgi:hypothetical protein